MDDKMLEQWRRKKVKSADVEEIEKEIRKIRRNLSVAEGRLRQAEADVERCCQRMNEVPESRLSNVLAEARACDSKRSIQQRTCTAMVGIIGQLQELLTIKSCYEVLVANGLAKPGATFSEAERLIEKLGADESAESSVSDEVTRALNHWRNHPGLASRQERQLQEVVEQIKEERAKDRPDAGRIGVLEARKRRIVTSAATLNDSCEQE